MRAYISILFDRPIKTSDYISPGGYEVEVKGKRYQFDFNESCGGVDENNPCIASFELRDEDRVSFSEIDQFRQHIHEIDKITECYVYTGENVNDTLKPIKLLSFSISDSGMEYRKNPESTEFVTCETYNGDIGITTFTFTRKLLDTCESFCMG
jgi:hypothetical protein